MGDPIDYRGELMTNVTVDFGDFWFPAYYDATLNSINVVQDRLKEKDLGEWPIEISASFREVNGTETTIKTQITLTVYEDLPEVDPISIYIPPEGALDNTIPKDPIDKEPIYVDTKWDIVLAE